MKRQRSAATAIALLVASCSSGSPASTTVAALPTTTTTTTLATAPTTRVEPSTTTASPSTTLASDLVGSPEAKDALIEAIVAEVGEDNLGGRENVPFLDINHPDPLVAMQSIIAFDSWVITTWPDPPMVEIYTADESPGRNAYARGVSSIFKGGSRIVYLGSPYTAVDYRVVDASEALTEEVMADLPRGAVAIAYESSSGPFEVRRVEDETVDASSEGWETRTVVTVLVPTSLGWQIWFEEA